MISFGVGTRDLAMTPCCRLPPDSSITRASPLIARILIASIHFLARRRISARLTKVKIPPLVAMALTLRLPPVRARGNDHENANAVYLVQTRQFAEFLQSRGNRLARLLSITLAENEHDAVAAVATE